MSGANLHEACASTKFRGKARIVSASASSSANKPASLQGFTVARPAQPAAVTGIAAKARPIPSSDPFGVERFERSRAKTPQGYARAFNSVSRELIGLPLTRKQQDEIRAQRPKLKPKEIDKNIYRTPEIRERAPRDMPKRRRPGWVCCQFVIPRPVAFPLGRANHKSLRPVSKHAGRSRARTHCARSVGHEISIFFG